MKIASNNNTIQYNTIQYNNLGLMNDFQNKNIKYNTGDIERDSFVKPATTMTNSVNISFGSELSMKMQRFWDTIMNFKNKIDKAIDENNPKQEEILEKKLKKYANEHIKELDQKEKDELLIDLMSQYGN